MTAHIPNIGQQIIKPNKKFSSIFLDFLWSFWFQSKRFSIVLHSLTTRESSESCCLGSEWKWKERRDQQLIFICLKPHSNEIFDREKLLPRERHNDSYWKIVQMLAELIEKKVHFVFMTFQLWVFDSLRPILSRLKTFFFISRLLLIANIANAMNIDVSCLFFNKAEIVFRYTDICDENSSSFFLLLQSYCDTILNHANFMLWQNPDRNASIKLIFCLRSRWRNFR